MSKWILNDASNIRSYRQSCSTARFRYWLTRCSRIWGWCSQNKRKRRRGRKRKRRNSWRL